MVTLKQIRNSVLIALWMMILTFPIMVIKVNTIENIVIWRWMNLLYIGVGTVILSIFWFFLINRRKLEPEERKRSFALKGKIETLKGVLAKPVVQKPLYAALLVIIIIFPFVSSLYQTGIMITALMYVILGLGLNIVVGLGGLLHLGYAAFYAVGAYTYALLHRYLGLSFWVCLPIGALSAMLLGILVGLPVLRLRGDYLAIVTLAFGEIVRILLENLSQYTGGPAGISGIPRPSFFGIKMSLSTAMNYTYFLTFALVLFTIFVVRRLEHSRLGRSWVAMREDEVASEAMGIDITRAKLSSFALGALWAGLAGVFFSAKTTFVNPASFTLWESVIILCVVVLGGIGSIKGVVLGAIVIILLPEYLRAFSQYRMLFFGLILVMMMIFRPGGFIPAKRRVYTFDKAQLEESD
ncbi:MAG: branched-chain amino acid ABC transporter permease [Spirochaetales bacterium]|nr:branched-chain amino acid ABC transporter permease [Spirochaetales bacterium]